MELAPSGLGQLSCAQRGLWFVDQLARSGRAYTFHATYDIVGILDVIALGRAFDYVVRRHDTLRSHVTVVGGVPYSVIEPASSVTGTLGIHDLRGTRDSPHRARHALADLAGHAFDHLGGPLFRANLIREADDHCHVHISVHHLVFDAESRRIFEREVSHAYESFLRSRDPAQPPLPITYGQFAARQNAWLASEEAAADIAYWTRQLDGVPTAELPGDRARPNVPSFRGADLFFDIPQITRRNVNAISAELRTTSFVVLLAAYQILLSRYTGVIDITVGAPFSGRTSIELEQVIGLFVNTVGLRAGLHGDPTFAELVGRLRKAVLAAIDHQDVPFERQVTELGPVRDPSRNPIFQNWFDSTDHRAGSGDVELSLPGATSSLIRSAETTTRFDTELHIELEDSGLRGHLVYATDLFDAPRMRRLSEHYLALLQAVTSDPRRRLSALGLLSADQERQVLRLGHRPQPATTPPPATVTAWFEECATAHPDRIAVKDAGQALTYLELRRQADEVASWLRRQGAGPESVVGVCADRDVSLVVALLGVVQSGAAYLPLDPALPAGRIGHMLAGAGSAQVLTSARTRNAVPAGHWRVAGPDDYLGARLTTPRPASATPPAPRADNAVYVIYTSGSTGEPKGVIVTHRSLCNLVRWHLSAYGGEPGGEVISATANVAFDAAGWEIWPALLGGATLDLVPSTSAASPEALVRHLRSVGTTAMFAATPLAEQLIREPLGEQTRLRCLLTGGDAFRPRSADAPGVPVFNHYGPTETTVVATAGDGIGPPWSDLSIGKPIDGVTTYLLDRYLHLVPAGVTGELFVAGEGVGRGYVGKPALTAERFLPDPFATRAGARMYRTGDLARWTPQGTLAFHGRTDRQIKIRGLRIEPAEIESALLNFPGVVAAAVTAAPFLGTSRLIAYVTANPEVTDPLALADRLRSVLPGYMIPAAIVPVASMPMNSNGKLDWSRLPEPTVSPLPYRPPQGPAEESVAALWSDVLGVPRVGGDDDFFELGGHSLSAARLAARISEVFGVDFSVRAIFERRRLGDLAAAVEGHVRARIAAMSADEIAEALSELGTAEPGTAEEEQMPVMTTIQSRFEHQAELTPDAHAVACGRDRLTYSELNSWSNKLARAITGQGAGRGDIVGLYTGRCAAMAVAVLATLKAGAAYLPLDPEHPVERLKFMVKDAGVKLVITLEREIDWGVPTVGADQAGVRRYQDGNLQVGASPLDLMYVLYTSGSTGRPKGVAMHQLPQVWLFDWSGRNYAAHPVALHYFPITSDVASYELLTTWESGGCVVIAQESERYDVAALARLIRVRGVTRILLPVSMLEQLARHASQHPEDVASVREFCTTGDKLVITRAIRDMLDALPDALLESQYGSTEVNVVTTMRLRAPAAAWPELPSVGAPMGRARVYVLDSALSPVPAKVPGEIFVAGDPVAYGYLGQPALTAERFLPDPFSEVPGARMYRMGDLGRWRPDGTLDCLGRVDFQVKIGGYRVEPGEIECVLRDRADVRDAAVVAVTGATTSLCAYLVPAGDAPAPQEVREYLRGTLPAHMIPNAFVFLDHLPMTRTGKVDRNRLPAPTHRDRTPAEPATDAERTIAAIWAQVLGREQVGVDENFFELGGHSLLIMSVIYRLRSEFGVDLSLRALFDAPTVAELAASLASGPKRQAPALRRRPGQRD